KRNWACRRATRLETCPSSSDTRWRSETTGDATGDRETVPGSEKRSVCETCGIPTELESKFRRPNHRRTSAAKKEFSAKTTTHPPSRRTTQLETNKEISG